MTDHDYETVTAQLGREPKPFTVAARCPFGKPSAIRNEPSRKLPTTFWLTCPALNSAIAGVEAGGGVKAVQELVGEKEVERIHAEHRERYGVRVAGVREGGYIKCLHAFTALHLSGEIPNAVAEWTLSRIEEPYPGSGCCTRREPASGA
ncbi:DUF501 domain-containing protein [Rubrobacter indicoceani]|uniref:DUF501 domain-containing protein n=1 Tax=Rubrobacter indicoceani TaxID=2051957 RepID=UPI000E5B3B38|nr:DUF501 domain-containing protein [Rubrobacter indicoceani]